MSPLYTYNCSKCKKVYEVQVPLSKYGAAIKCPHCKKKLERLLDAPTFRVK